MPFHKGWLPREGFCGDAVGHYANKSILNPALTVPILLLALYTSRGKDFSKDHPVAFSRLKFLVYLGLAKVAHRYLNRRALNNGYLDKYDWKKEVVVITGGADGIGKRIVMLLAEQGIKVAVLDIQPLTYSAPPTVSYHKCDIRSPSAVAEAATAIRKHFGTVPTVLINNAGVVRGKPLLDLTEADVRLTFDVNSLSHYWLAKEFLPSMIRANHGMVVTVSSSAAYVTTANLTDYASSKAAALAFHEGLTSELKMRYSAPRVRTIVVTQGYTRTPLFEGWAQRNEFLSPWLEPETVAEETVKLILNGESAQLIIPGSYNFFAVWLRVFPYWLALPFRNRMQYFMGGNFRGRMVIDPNKEEKKKIEGK